jgi:hypothetical protein
MKSVRLVAAALVLTAGVTPAGAQTSMPGAGPMMLAPAMPMNHSNAMHDMAAPAGKGSAPAGPADQSAGVPVQPGQAAFGAAQEIVRTLLADPGTDWSKVNIDALRQHLIDMNEVVMRAKVQKQPIEHGLRMDVTGSGRTLPAIQRMIPAHAQDINGMFGWTVQAKTLPDGDALTVTGRTPADVQKIRALGFLGNLVLGTHQMHHLAMAKGEMMHMR